MRILQINKFFYPKGGSETYYFSLCNLLEKHKHDVVHFSMQDNKNENSPYKDYFVSHLNITKPQVNLSSIGQISRLIWSNEAQKKLEQLLTKEKIDIAHLHNIDRHLTPSIIPVLKKSDLHADQCFEIVVIGQQIIKAAFQIIGNKELNYAYVISCEGVVITCWANAEDDDHQTLDETKYIVYAKA